MHTYIGYINTNIFFFFFLFLSFLSLSPAYEGLYPRVDPTMKKERVAKQLLCKCTFYPFCFAA